MRRSRTFLAIFASFSFLLAARADVTVSTTSPTSFGTELVQLREQVATLQAENEMLRAQLASISVAASAPAGTKTAAIDPGEKPILGIEGIMQGIPKDEIPHRDDPAQGLRHTLMIKWVRDHANGKAIALKGRFSDASGITGGHFVVRVGSGDNKNSYEATIVMPESDAASVLALHAGSPVHLTGHIKNADVTRTSSGRFVILLDLDGATINASY